MKIVTSAALISLSLAMGVANASNTGEPASKTRAEVVAELQDAMARGLMPQGEFDYPVAIQSTSAKTRQEVVDELAAARAAGMQPAGELNYPPVAANAGSETRAEVVRELAEYKAANPVVEFES